jgi:hypothetical protein
MAKKTAKATPKPGQQKSKEEQWRRRMAAQGQVATSSVLVEPEVAPADATTYADGEGTAETAPRPTTATPASKRTLGTSSAIAQRSAAAARSARARLTTYTLSLDEEMAYIRHDIRKLVILTTACVAVLIALAFIVPTIIK